MKISKKYPQFNNEEVLIIISGTQEAKMFLAKNGEITKLVEFRVESPVYSDRDGYFKSRVKNIGVIRSGAVYESKKKETIKKFLKKLEENVKKVFAKQRIDKIYLFAPSHLKNKAKKAVVLASHKKIDYFHAGDFYHQHLFDVLEIVKKEEKEKSIPKKMLLKRF